MQKTRLVPLSESLALAAADVSLEFRLALADSIVYATARAEGAELVTSNGDLQGLPGRHVSSESGKDPPLMSWWPRPPWSAMVIFNWH